MENDIIAEGFQQSERTHDLRCTTLIGEGDISVYAAILIGVSYGYLVKKVMCANHVFKCYTKKLFSIANSTKGFPGKEATESWKLLSIQNIITLKHLAGATIKRHAKSSSRCPTLSAIPHEIPVKETGCKGCGGPNDRCET